MSVTVEADSRWGRPCVTFRWSGFVGLLPEERFHRLVQVIPEAFRQRELAGYVWLELAPDEPVDRFLSLPRSEDVADREAELYAQLVTAGFFGSLQAMLGPAPQDRCANNFRHVEAVLAAQRVRPAQAREFKLLFIREGVYCDCQVLASAQPALATRHEHVK